jgi:hypothetical protein
MKTGDFRYWPVTSRAATQRFRRYWGVSGLELDIVNRALLTLLDRLLRVVGAMQHGQRAAIPAKLLRRAEKR